MDNLKFDRRQMLVGAAAGTILALPGCTGLPGFSLTDAIRRLLSLSSQSAFAQLLQPGGFYDSNIARIALPDRFGGSGGSGILGAVLGSSVFRRRLQKQLNKAAEKGAERAAPLVADAVRNVSIADAAGIVRGGPQAATSFLRGQMGGALINAMLPGIGGALRLAGNDVVSRAIRSVSGFDVGALASDINQKADNAIWSSIGAEEANIRADPQATNDPLLIGVFGLGR
ncbi:MAG: DUF4197 domain-containing protein [Sphingorhabdus sp.]